MRVIILGSAAGGGVPQWNCGCPNCTDARHDNRGRTQSCVAVSADGERWVLLNASPDLRTQLAAHHELWPRGRRGSGIAAVILTDGEIDHTLGLLLMRESATRLPVYARSEEHTSELQSHSELVCRLLLEKKKSLHDQSDHARKGGTARPLLAAVSGSSRLPQSRPIASSFLVTARTSSPASRAASALWDGR